MNNPLTDPLRRKKILFRSLHRGCKETDLLLGEFATRHLESLNATELSLFEALLDEADWDIWHAVATSESTALPPQYAPLIAKLRDV